MINSKFDIKWEKQQNITNYQLDEIKGLIYKNILKLTGQIDSRFNKQYYLIKQTNKKLENLNNLAFDIKDIKTNLSKSTKIINVLSNKVNYISKTLSDTSKEHIKLWYKNNQELQNLQQKLNEADKKIDNIKDYLTSLQFQINKIVYILDSYDNAFKQQKELFCGIHNILEKFHEKLTSIENEVKKSIREKIVKFISSVIKTILVKLKVLKP